MYIYNIYIYIYMYIYIIYIYIYKYINEEEAKRKLHYAQNYKRLNCDPNTINNEIVNNVIKT